MKERQRQLAGINLNESTSKLYRLIGNEVVFDSKQLVKLFANSELKLDSISHIGDDALVMSVESFTHDGEIPMQSISKIKRALESLSEVDSVEWKASKNSFIVSVEDGFAFVEVE